jgi:hypothetical protein
MKITLLIKNRSIFLYVDLNGPEVFAQNPVLVEDENLSE